MIRFLRLGLVLLSALPAREAAAQSAAPPVELGFDASALATNDRGGFGRGPRLIVNLDGRNAIELTASLQPLSLSGAMEKRETDRYLVAYKRVVHAAGRARVFATVGGGIERTVRSVPGFTGPGPSPVPFPPSTTREVLPTFTVGSGIDLRIGRRVAVVLASSFLLSDRFAGRLSGGLLVPLGAYPEPSDPLGASVPWAPLSEGDRAWVVTSDGREVTGEVVVRSAARLGIRTERGLASFAADEIRAIDATDRIGDGVVLGATIGGVGAVAPAVLVTYLICALEEECGVRDVLAVNALFVGMGIGIGAAVGALTDSLREGRAPLYRRDVASTFTVEPLLRKQGVGAAATIRW
jgi:hypothetical protein